MESSELIKAIEEKVKFVNNSLETNIGWKNIYLRRADEIIAVMNSDKYLIQPICFSKNLTFYTNHTKLTSHDDNTKEFDLRFLGQSVASIIMRKIVINGVEEWSSYILTSTKQDKSNKDFFGLNLSFPKEELCVSDKAKQFFEFFNKSDNNTGHSPEHEIENFLLKAFSVKKGSKKLLRNIQPVVIDNAYFQLITPFSASKSQHTFSSRYKGGGIDILGRIRTKDNQIALVVFELKDKYENPQKVIQQASTYAAFLGNLLTEETFGEKWWKIFGYSRKPTKIKLIACTLMPKAAKPKKYLHGAEGFETKINDKISLELHSLFFDKTNNVFLGSLKDLMKE
ncbi:MAG: hypothetical protein J1E16_02395 [Muribaculaceae bacterium]|nr:hypothetical protein [Muribaculaceae bacterium]